MLYIITTISPKHSGIKGFKELEKQFNTYIYKVLRSWKTYNQRNFINLSS